MTTGAAESRRSSAQRDASTPAAVPRVERLRRRQDFVTVMRRGRRSRHGPLRLAALCNGLPYSRCGFAVGRRVGMAVVRNKTKRRLREIMRRLPLKPGYDIVVTAEPIAASVSFHELERAAERCAERSGLLGAAKR